MQTYLSSLQLKCGRPQPWPTLAAAHTSLSSASDGFGFSESLDLSQAHAKLLRQDLLSVMPQVRACPACTAWCMTHHRQHGRDHHLLTPCVRQQFISHISCDQAACACTSPGPFRSGAAGNSSSSSPRWSTLSYSQVSASCASARENRCCSPDCTLCRGLTLKL